MEKQELWKDLVLELESLQKLQTDPMKILSTSQKLSSTYVKLKNLKDAGKSLENVIKSLNPNSGIDLDREQEVELLTKIVNLYQQYDKEFQSKEIELRRKRLNADPLEILKKKVEKEATETSRLEAIYKRLLELNQHEWTSNYLEFLWRKLAIVDDKDNIRNEIVTLANQCEGSLPLEILLQLSDYPLSNTPMDLIQKAYTLTNDFGKICQTFQDWKLHQTDPMEVLSSLLLLKSYFLPPLLGQRLAAQVSFDSKDYDNAVAYCNQALSSLDILTKLAYSTPNEPFLQTKNELQLIQALSYTKMDQKLYKNDSLVLFKQILQRYSNQQIALLNLGILLSHGYGKHEEALKMFDKLLKLDTP